MYWKNTIGKIPSLIAQKLKNCDPQHPKIDQDGAWPMGGRPSLIRRTSAQWQSAMPHYDGF
jgi:hypothetical protein